MIDLHKTFSVVYTPAVLARMQDELADCFDIPNDLLPESYQVKEHDNNPDGYQSMARLKAKLAKRAPVERDPADVSVKFDSHKNIVESTPERLAAINEYRRQVETRPDADICYGVKNEEKLNAAYMAWGAVLHAEGVIDLDE
jgi:hypothetical protein